MRHVHQENGAHVFGHLGKARKVNMQGVGAGPGDDQLGFALMGFALHGLVVDGLIGIKPVGHHVEPLSADVERHAMGQMPTFGQAHAHDGVTWLQKGQKHRFISGRAAMRLHIGRIGAKNLLHAVHRQLLGHVDVFAAAVVALAGIAFGVFIGQLAALRGHDGRRGVVFAGDQFNMVFLARVLGHDGGPQLGIGLFNKNAAVVHGWVLEGC